MHLRRNGLISSGGRGRGGADMTRQDVTNLLLGVIGANNAIDAPKVVDQARNCQLDMVVIDGKKAWTEDGTVEGLEGAANFPFWTDGKLNIPLDFLFDNDKKPLTAGELIDWLFETLSSGRLGPFFKNGEGRRLMPLHLEILRPGKSVILHCLDDGDDYQCFYHNNNISYDRYDLVARLGISRIREIASLISE